MVGCIVSSFLDFPFSALETQNFETMAHKFEPLQNDLILRTAWGEISVVYLEKKCTVNSPRPESRKSSHVGYASGYDSIL